MTERQKELIRMAVIYAQAHFEDVTESFELIEAGFSPTPGKSTDLWSVDGVTISSPSEGELDGILRVC